MGRALLVLESPQDRQKAISWINKAPVGTRVEFKASKRSLPQNDRLWAMLTDIQAHMKRKGLDYTTDQFKVIFLHAWGKEVEFLPGLDGKTFVPYGQSSSDLSKEEMTSFIEFIIAWGAENGVIFHDPNTEASGTPSPERPDEGDTPAPAMAPAHAEVSPEPVASTPSQATGSSDFGKFQFGEGEQQHLKDFARNALDDAAGDSDTPAKDAAVERLFMSYREVIESEDGKSVLNAMGVPLAAVVNGKRSREMAAEYIARELLGCSASELEAIRHG